MSTRYWCPQAWSFYKGWIDLPSLASTQQKTANDQAKAFAEENRTQTRTVRKTKGWEPFSPTPSKPENSPQESKPPPSKKMLSEPIKTSLPLEGPGEDLFLLQEEVKRGLLPSAVRLARLLERREDYKGLVTLAITGYYNGWDALFPLILEKLPPAFEKTLFKFILETQDQEFSLLYYRVLEFLGRKPFDI